MDIDYGLFIWDSSKEDLNLLKHGVDFETAALVFLDPLRKIYHDTKHDHYEPRMFCVGKVHHRVLTVRYVYRSGRIRIIGAGYWRRGRAEYEK